MVDAALAQFRTIQHFVPIDGRDFEPVILRLFIGKSRENRVQRRAGVGLGWHRVPRAVLQPAIDTNDELWQ
jgi:hypothetical protein